MISIEQGGFFFYAIGVLGFVVLLIAIERYLKLGIMYRMNSRKLIQKMKDAFVTDSFQEVEKFAANRKNKPIARLAEVGVISRNQSAEQLHIALEVEIAHWVPLIERRVNSLSTLANISTLLGLVGTVVGLIKSFGAIGNQVAEAAARSQALAAGVSESMMTTAAGLIVAIPALLFHLHISGMARGLISDLDYAALELKKLALNHRKVDDVLRKSSIRHLGSNSSAGSSGSVNIPAAQSSFEVESFDEATVTDFYITKTERKG